MLSRSTARPWLMRWNQPSARRFQTMFPAYSGLTEIALSGPRMITLDKCFDSCPACHYLIGRSKLLVESPLKFFGDVSYLHTVGTACKQDFWMQRRLKTVSTPLRRCLQREQWFRKVRKMEQNTCNHAFFSSLLVSHCLRSFLWSDPDILARWDGLRPAETQRQFRNRNSFWYLKRCLRWYDMRAFPETKVRSCFFVNPVRVSKML